MNETDEYAALLKAVRTEPDENTPRLVLADWLEEHGDKNRADVIRLQIRLATTTPVLSTADAYWGYTNRLVNAIGRADWIPRTVHGYSILKAYQIHSNGTIDVEYESTSERGINPILTVSRGFVSVVSIAYTDAPLVDPIWDLFRTDPIEAFVLCDRAPYRMIGTESHFIWCIPPHRVYGAYPVAAHVPTAIGRFLKGHAPIVKSFRYLRDYPSRAAAIESLNAACLAYGRDRAQKKRLQDLKWNTL